MVFLAKNRIIYMTLGFVIMGGSQGQAILGNLARPCLKLKKRGLSM